MERATIYFEMEGLGSYSETESLLLVRKASLLMCMKGGFAFGRAGLEVGEVERIDRRGMEGGVRPAAFFCVPVLTANSRRNRRRRLYCMA